MSKKDISIKKSSKKILIISCVLVPEPVVSAKLTFDLAQYCSLEGKVTVLSPKPTRPYKFNFKNTTTNLRFRHLITDSFTYPKSGLIGRFVESYSFGACCSKFIKENKSNIDVIYANTWPLFAQLLTVQRAAKYNIPVILHIQDVYPESLSNKIPFIKKTINTFLLPIDKFILKKSSKIIAISEKMKAYLLATRGIESHKIEVVINWQDETDFINYKQKVKKEEQVRSKLFTFMYLGNIGPVAGIDVLIEAFAKANMKNARLVIAGSGTMKNRLQEKSKSLHQSTIEFWDVPDGEVPGIQDQADVLLLPIKKGAASSSIPSKLPAYMFSEKPIIACVDENTDTADAILLANCGWVLPAEDINSLSEMLCKVSELSDEDLKQKGRNGFRYAIQHFSKKNNLPKVARIIKEHIAF